MAKEEGRILLCSNDLVQSVKEYNLVEHKLFYNLYYYFRLRERLVENNNGFIEGYDSENKIVYLDIRTTKRILGKRYSRNELQDLFDKTLPKGIRLKDKVGFISIFERLEATEENGEWEIKYQFTNTFIELAEFEIPFKKPHTALDLNEMLDLKSKYSQRLYEIYKQYSGNHGRKGQNNYMMPKGYFYDYFNISSNTPISKALNFVEDAKKELHNKLGIVITYERVKKGREITHIHFKFI